MVSSIEGRHGPRKLELDLRIFRAVDIGALLTTETAPGKSAKRMLWNAKLEGSNRKKGSSQRDPKRKTKRALQKMNQDVRKEGAG